MGTRTAVTDADGTYRFTAVTPGDYVVVFELAGFSTVRNEGIRVSLGFTATVNAALKVASLQESVTVTGQSPVVDTSATQIGNTFDAKQLSALPTSRDYFSLLAGSPAVQMSRIDVGGSTNGTQQGFVVYGTTRPGARDLRRPQRHRSDRRVRQLSRHRRHGGSADQHRRALAPRRRRRACSRSSSASPAATSSAARSSAAIRRRAGRRSTSTPIRLRAA